MKLFPRKRPKFAKSPNPSPAILEGLVAYNRYGGYFVPQSSIKRPAVQRILRGGVHEIHTVDFMRENCGEGDIIHAGTYYGDFLPGLASALTKGAILWAFEPNLENYRCAQITTLINQLNNVKLMNAGLGAQASASKMLVETEDGKSMGGGSTILKENRRGKTIDVQLVRIDDVVSSDRQVAIIQLDVEGYEKEALCGALETISRCKPILILEDNEKIIDSIWFNDNFLSKGYEVVGMVHKNTILKFKSM